MALEQGCEVFAVPGLPLDPRYSGTNGLIRDSAVMTESLGDIVANLKAIKSSGEHNFSTHGKIGQPIDITKNI